MPIRAICLLQHRWFQRQSEEIADNGVQGLTCASLGYLLAGVSPLDPALSLRSIAMPTAADAPTAADRSARRGPVPLPAADRREHCVSARLNDSELAQLDARRGRFQRGEWLRMAALDQLPPTVPAVNARAWGELAPLAANFNQAQAAIHRGDADGHDAALLRDIHQAVNSLRRELVGLPP